MYTYIYIYIYIYIEREIYMYIYIYVYIMPDDRVQRKGSGGAAAQGRRLCSVNSMVEYNISISKI